MHEVKILIVAMNCKTLCFWSLWQVFSQQWIMGARCTISLNELVHECIMGTGPDNKRGRGHVFKRYLHTLKLATLIWKVTDSQKIDFCVQSANFNFNFLSHFCIDFENLCAHQQEEILTIPKHPQKSSFWWVLAKKTAKNEVAQKLLF